MHQWSPLVDLKGQPNEQLDPVLQEVLPSAVKKGLCENMQYLKGQPNEQPDPVMAGGGALGLEEGSV